MRRPFDPQTGQARRAARDSLFALLVGAVLLGLLVEMVLNCMPVPTVWTAGWWIAISVAGALALAALYGLVIWDDRRIGRSETQIELLLPYVASHGPADARIGRRRSYALTLDAETAWNAYRGRAEPGPAADKRPFHQAILPEHMLLVRHLLLVYLARFGRRGRPDERMHGFLRLNVPVEELPWEALPPPARDNPVSLATGSARPDHLPLPRGTRLEMYDRGEVLLRLRWRPVGRLRRLGCALLGLGFYRPGGQVTVRWLGPLSAVRPADKRYEQMTARLPDVDPGAQVHVVSTRLVVEVENRWNALESVARFGDWATNLASYLETHLDYWFWREYALERTIEDLDWKIGWIDRDQEPGLAARLRRLDERLARLEAHLWPGEPPSGGGDGAWLSGGEPDAGSGDPAHSPG